MASGFSQYLPFLVVVAAFVAVLRLRHRLAIDKRTLTRTASGLSILALVALAELGRSQNMLNHRVAGLSWLSPLLWAAALVGTFLTADGATALAADFRIRRQAARQSARMLARRLYRLRKLGHTAETRLIDAVERVAHLVMTELKTDLVRISVSEGNGDFLASQAMITAGSARPVTPADGSLVLSLMPAHERALLSGRVLHANRRTANRVISDAEATHALVTPLGAVMLVPIVVDGRTLGLISMADTSDRGRDKFSAADISFTACAAAWLGDAMRRALTERAGRRQTLRLKRKAEIPLREQVKSSLSGIIGSVEMLRRGKEMGDQLPMERCLAIIDKSVHRLSGCLDQVSVPAGSEE